MTLSATVVIPTWNEESNIAEAIQSAEDAGADRIIVVDGGSQDQTVAIAMAADQRRSKVEVISANAGRGSQLAAGTMRAQSEYVIMLHADSRLPALAVQQIEWAGSPSWGGFKQVIDSNRALYRWLATGNALRVRCLGRVFGDQAMFVRTSLLHQVGGVPKMPLMEDIELSKLLRQHARPVLLNGPVQVSSRRWQQAGVIRQTLLNWRIQWHHWRGVDTESLVQMYRSKRSQ